MMGNAKIQFKNLFSKSNDCAHQLTALMMSPDYYFRFETRDTIVFLRGANYCDHRVCVSVLRIPKTMCPNFQCILPADVALASLQCDVYFWFCA